MFAAGGSFPTWSFALLAAGQGLYALAIGMSNSHEMSFRQLVTPDELQARTNTTLRSLNRAVMVVVAPLAGILADAWGIRAILLVAVAIFVTLRYADRILRRFGPTGTAVILRMSAFILLCIGVQIIWNGASALLRTAGVF